MLRLAGAGRSHVGLVRDSNEDSGFVGPTCLVVADGVAGSAAGEVASATTTYVVSSTALVRSGLDPEALLTEAVRVSQEQVALGSKHDPTREGMATTLTALVTDGTRFVLGHLGDSRGYVLRGEELTRVSHDHTWVQAMIDEGRLRPDEALLHPWRNVVLRTVNGTPAMRPDLVPLPLKAGDRVLLASDGLTDLVSESWVTDILLASPDAQDAVDGLVAAALSCGGKDNITVIVATVVDGPVVDGAVVRADGELLGAAREPGLVVDPGLIRHDASA